MHILKFDQRYTRRHFLKTLAQGALAAGVLRPLWDVVAATGDISRAYPDEALSVEHYSKGRVKAGGTLDANNVDSVKDLLDPVTYHQIKNDGRVIDIIATPTDIFDLNPAPYIEATLRNKGRARFDEKGNVVSDDGGPWIGGHPFPDAKSAKEMMAGVALSWGRHDSALYCTNDRIRNREGKLIFEYQAVFTEVQATGRLTLAPKPHLPGHLDKIRYNAILLTFPTDVNGSAFLNIWPYDQTRFPDFHAYLPAFKRVRRFSANQRFEPLAPGHVFFSSDAWTMGDPFLTWGNFRVIDKTPFIGGVGGRGGGWHSEHPNWDAPFVGGKNGEKYLRAVFSLVPETYIVEMEPIKYPRAPYSKRRVWIDARTMTPMASVAFDRAGKAWKQFEFGTALYQKPAGEKFAVGGETYWSWTHLHIHDIQEDRVSSTMQLKKNNAGYTGTFNDPNIYDDFCTLQAISRLGT
jgi:hypothetical protein